MHASPAGFSRSFARFLSFAVFMTAAAHVAHAQCTCTRDNQTMTFNGGSALDIMCCMDLEANAVWQAVGWCVRNTTADKLHVVFSKVYHLTCGTTKVSKADFIIDGGRTIKGDNFSGNQELWDAIVAEDCSGRYRIKSIAVRDLSVENMSQKERDEQRRIVREQEELRRKHDQEQVARKRKEREEAEERARRENMARRNEEEQLRRTTAVRNQEQLQQTLNTGLNTLKTVMGLDEGTHQDVRREGTSGAAAAQSQPGTAPQPSYCARCNGTGKMTCRQCRGEGNTVCSVCTGRGKLVCGVCGGSGNQQLGRTSIDCPPCRGTGYQICLACLGNGHKTCLDCFGHGWSSCSECGGTGRYR